MPGRRNSLISMELQRNTSLRNDDSVLTFGPYNLEGVKRLLCGDQLLEIRPRPLTVLRYLAERQGRLVTGDELLRQLWPGIYVSRTVLRVGVGGCDRVLKDAPGP